MAEVHLDNITKIFPDGTRAVDELSLSIADGAFMIFVGPSGCGKTTALRMVAGLEDVSKGEVRIGGVSMNDLEPGERDVAMVFQNYALYPHMTVYENMNFPLKLSGMPRNAREAHIRSTARMLGIEVYLDRRPARLSGGQRQRVAMGRALVREPQVFLMDEPLSNLDAKLRVQMRAEITSLQKQLGITTIYVTHDQVEALTMGDQIAVMRDGRLQQVADPRTLYEAPANLFVAAFVGAPPMNLIEGEIVADTGRAYLQAGPLRIATGPGELSQSAGPGPVVAGVRPEKLVLAPDDGSDRTISGTVRFCESIGSDLLVSIALDGVPALSSSTVDLSHVVEDRAESEILTAHDTASLTVRLPTDTMYRAGDRLALQIPDNALHLFDAQTGVALVRPEIRGLQHAAETGTGPQRQLNQQRRISQ